MEHQYARYMRTFYVFDVSEFTLFWQQNNAGASTISSSQEHLVNTVEFSNYPLTGAWDGFWWAVVTMTTVG